MNSISLTFAATILLSRLCPHDSHDVRSAADGSHELFTTDAECRTFGGELVYPSMESCVTKSGLERTHYGVCRCTSDFDAQGFVLHVPWRWDDEDARRFVCPAVLGRPNAPALMTAATCASLRGVFAPLVANDEQERFKGHCRCGNILVTNQALGPALRCPAEDQVPTAEP